MKLALMLAILLATLGGCVVVPYDNGSRGDGYNRSDGNYRGDRYDRGDRPYLHNGYDGREGHIS